MGALFLARIIHDGSSSPSLTLPHSMGEGWVGGRDRRAEPRGGVTLRLGVPKGVWPPSWGFYKGAGPLVRGGEAGSRAEPAREGGRMLTD